MRLRELILERYGPFTDRRLLFRADARLHVVHGANEAGKSSALAAVSDLLFGIPERTPFGFVHPMNELKIGAEIVDRAGGSLAFFRHKRRKNPLTDPAGQPIGDDTLVPYLAGLSREVFERAFGISAERLREGAREMLDASGETGATLFAAASGLRGLNALRQTLEEDADSIFSDRRGKDRRFYVAKDRYAVADKALREVVFGQSKFRQLLSEIDSADAGYRAGQDQRRTIQAERAGLERLMRLEPVVARIDKLKARLEQHADLPPVDPGFAARLRAALDGVEATDRARATARSWVDEAERERAALVVDERLIAKAAAIETLREEAGVVAAARRELPGVEAEVGRIRVDLAALATGLGLGEPGALRARQPTVAAMALVRRLSADGRKLADTLERLDRDNSEQSSTVARLESARAALGDAPDPRPLRERLAAFRPTLRRLDDRETLVHSIDEKARTLREQTGRLSPAVGDLALLAAVPWPDGPRIERFRSERDELTNENRDLSERRTKAMAARVTAEANLARLAAGGPVPTREAIEAARAERDHLWASVRARLEAGEAPEADMPDRSAPIEALEAAIIEADRLADAAVRDAERVAEHALASSSLAAADAETEALERAAADLERRWAGFHQAWTDAWSAAGIAPTMPADMARWANQLATLLERREALEADHARLTSIDADLAQIRDPLTRLAMDAGVPSPEGGPARLLAALETRLEALDRGRAAVLELGSRLDAAREGLNKLNDERERTKTARDHWAEAWGPAVALLLLGPSATHDEADATLAAWERLPNLLKGLDDGERRALGMSTEIKAFDDAVAALVEAVAPELDGYPPELAAKTLLERLKLEREAATRRTGLARRLADANAAEKTAKDNAVRAADELEQRLDALGLEANPTPSDLAHLADRLAEREAIGSDLDRRERELADGPDATDLVSIRATLAGFDPIAAKLRLEELDLDDQRATEAMNAAYAAREDALRRKGALETTFAAELARQQMLGAETELAEAARDWMVLRLARHLVDATIARHRESARDPLMARAGALLARLTGGAFAEIGEDIDEKDKPRLVAVRADRRTVAVEGLSEGTRDQFLLALRLAHIEHYARHAEPPPFIADDIFATFDEARTAHGLEALADIGDSLQPIVFTHHRHVADIALQRLGDRVDIVQLDI